MPRKPNLLLGELIQWHLPHCRYDQCPKCFGRNMKFLAKRDRVCEDCGQRLVLPVTTTKWFQIKTAASRMKPKVSGTPTKT